MYISSSVFKNGGFYGNDHVNNASFKSGLQTLKFGKNLANN